MAFIMKNSLKKNMPAFFAGFILIFFSCTPSPEYLKKNIQQQKGRPDEYIRVLLLKTNQRVVVESSGHIKISRLKDQGIVYNGKGNKFTFDADKFNNDLQFESWDAPIKIGTSTFRGMVELHKSMGSLYVVNVVTMREYLYGVVPSEMMAGWPLEALKAQAVAARTYCYYHIQKNRAQIYDVDSTTKFQVYKGLSSEKASTNKAVDETEGEIISYNNKPLLALFHSTCGGTTVNDQDVWSGGDDLPYLAPVKCPYCQESPYHNWQTTIPLTELKDKLQKKYSDITTISKISFQHRNGNVVQVVIEHRNGIIRMSGNEFRTMISPTLIKSTNFIGKKDDKVLVLSGHGWGHGVGLCQWGAKGMAASGKKYREILNFYFKDAKVITINYSNKNHQVAGN